MKSDKTNKDNIKTCPHCGNEFVVKRCQGNRKYCSRECAYGAELERKKELREKELKGEYHPKKKTRKRKTYKDPDTGTVYYEDKIDEKLVRVDKKCKKAGLSYGQYTSMAYAPRVCIDPDVVEGMGRKEKVYQYPTFKWKKNKKKAKNKEVYL